MRENALALLKEGTVIPAIPLALDANRQFDEKRQRALVRYYLDAGAGGVAVAVHTTQFEIRLPEFNMFELVTRVTAEEIDRYEAASGRVVIKVGGVCGPAAQACAEAAYLKSIGFDAVLLSPGGLADLSEDDMIARTKAVAAIMPVVGFYLQPAVGGRLFSVEYWKRLSDIENVVAIKAAPFNRYRTGELVHGVCMSARRDEIALYTGNDDNIVMDLLTEFAYEVNGVVHKKRFVGGLLGHWSVWTHAVVRLFEEIKAVRSGASVSAEMLTLAAQVTDSNAVLFDAVNGFAGCIPGVHEVLRRQGLFEGTWCLNPKEVLSPGQAAELDRVYAAYPSLTDDAFVKENLVKWLAD